MSIRLRLKDWLTRSPIVSVARRALDETWADSRTRSARDTRGRSRVVAFAALFIDLVRVFGASAIAALIFEEPPLRNVGQDTRHAGRRLLKSPGFSLFSVASLVLGVGATTAVYALMYAVFLKPVDVPNMKQLVNLETSDPPLLPPRFSWADYEILRGGQDVFSSIAASASFRETIVGLGTAELVFGEVVNGAYFETIGVRPEIGRLLAPADDRGDAPPVVVLSDETWRRQFSGDPAIVGKPIKIGPTTFDVIGVASPGFRGMATPNITPASVWVPMSAIPRVDWLRLQYSTDPAKHVKPWVTLRARLAPERTLVEAKNALATIGRTLSVTSPLAGSEIAHGGGTGRTWSLIPTSRIYNDEITDVRMLPIVGIVMGLVALVLLVACTNLASLSLARGVARRHEIAIRRALGASRLRLLREQLIEGVLVTTVAVGPALLLARWLLARTVDGFMVSESLPLHLDAQIDAPMVCFALAGSFVAFVVAGFWPSLHLTRTDVRGALAADSSANGALPRWNGRGRLIAWQVLCSACLVFVAVMLSKHIVSIRARDSGMAVDELSAVNFGLPARGQGDAESHQQFEELLRRIRQQPGVLSASLVAGMSFGQNVMGGIVTLPETPFRPDEYVGTAVELYVATPEVFRTLDVPILKGRPFAVEDTAVSAPVVILSASTARRLFKTTDVVGRRLLFHVGYYNKADATAVAATIVGVAADVDVSAFFKTTGDALYVPFTQQQHLDRWEPQFIVNSRDPAAMGQTLSAIVKRFDPEITIYRSGPVRKMWEGSYTMLRTISTVASALGLLALALAMAGLYGVLSQMILRRRREIGVRMALGADSRAVVRMVLYQGFRPVIEGVVAGLGVGLLVQVGLRAVFVSKDALVDPIVLVVVPIPFVVAALVASYLPARRAASVDPNVALREL